MDTSASLLESLCAGNDRETLVRLYSPLLGDWLGRHGTTSAEIDEVVREVLVVMTRRIAEVRRYPHPASFRAWLRRIIANSLRDYWRRTGRQPVTPDGADFRPVLDQLIDSHSDVSKLWDKEHDEFVTKFLLEMVRQQVSASHWQAYQRFALDGQSADEVARELNISANAVFIAKSRVLTKLRSLGRGLIDA